MRFCPECGAQLVAGAKFCVECGQRLEAASTRAKTLHRRITPAALTVFAAISAIGIAIAIVVISTSKTPQRAAMNESGSFAGDDKGLPPGHPKVELPPEAVKLIAEVESNANAKPGDLAAWNDLGEVCLRAATFDPAYLAKATAAYGHVLKIDPDNLDALRGVGNVNFDRHHFDQAIAAYEHYLTLKPDDPEVRTDLGTMYLFTGNADQAEVQYKRAIAAKPNFFEGYFNLGIAYGQEDKDQQARAAFDSALHFAPDDQSRDRVKAMIAKLEGGSTRGPQSAAVSATGPASPNGGGDTFQSALDQLIRSVPLAGPKVKSIQWPSSNRAVVLMDDFPMEQMPPFAKQKFIDDLSSRVDSAKSAHGVSGQVELDIADGASGRVMETVRR